MLLRREAPDGLSGWIGYAFTRHRYTDVVTRGAPVLRFRTAAHARAVWPVRLVEPDDGWRQFPLRLQLSDDRLHSRATRAGAGAPSLFGGGVPFVLDLSDARNTLRLPAYARLDTRADRTFMWSRRRVTVFAELANALNQQNLRNVPYGVDTRFS